LVWNVDTDFINFATPRILRNLAKYTYVCTLSGGLVAAIQALQYGDISQLSSRELGTGLLPLFYAVLAADPLYRPAAIRADFLLHLDSDSPASKNYIAQHEEKTSTNYSGIVGLLGVVSIIVVTILLGGPLLDLINIPSFVVVVGLAMAIQFATIGAHDARRALLAMRVFFVEVPANALRRKDAINLRAFAVYMYAGAAIGTLIGCIQVLNNLTDLTVLPIATAVMLVCPLYAIVAAECFVRPCANRIDFLLSQKESQARDEME